jgi:hypothetical protein
MHINIVDNISTNVCDECYVINRICLILIPEDESRDFLRNILL